MMKGQKGITLVALVITIIVMLILVGVSVTVAIQGGLFGTAKKARDNTNEERVLETNLSKEEFNINDKVINGLEEYVNSL